MTTRRFAFRRASNEDPLYRMVQSGDYTGFWAHHDENNGTSSLSEDLKDIISCMIQHNPLHRPAISEALAHEWFGGERLTHEKIVEDLMERHNVVLQKIEAEREQRRTLRESTVNKLN